MHSKDPRLACSADLSKRPGINRRDFMKGTALASAAGLAFPGEACAAEEPGKGAETVLPPMPAIKGTLPMGKIGKVEFSRLMLGGNLITAIPHARDLSYVAMLMRRYNTEAKILETLELAEINGINCVNLPARGENWKFLKKHWARGGKIKWVAQTYLEPNFDLSISQLAVDEGASAIYMQGHQTEHLYDENRLDVLAKSIEMVKKQGVPGGAGAHCLEVMRACEKADVGADFYVKTLHSHNYSSAPKEGESDRWGIGKADNSWCDKPEEVIKFFADVKKPWIAFKVMAAGAIPPMTAFPYAFNNGADFVLAGMFDWQVEPNVALARRVIENAKRTRPWCS